MTITNNDVLLVNRGSTSYKIKYENVKNDITGDVDQFPEAPQDGNQYARENGAWTQVTYTPAYSDSDVDTHLNTSTANANQVLGWSGSDYEWKDAGTSGSGNPNLISYTFPSGQNRTLQSRLEDYVSIKDFGAVGCDPTDPNDTTDDTIAIRAALNAGHKGVYFPSGTYRVSETLDITGVTIFGDGMHSVILYEPTVQTHIDGYCLRLTVNHTPYIADDGFEIRDIQVLKAANNTSKGGIVIRDGGSGAIQGPWTKVVLENVTIGAYYDQTLGTRGYFKKGLTISNVGGVYANNITIANNIIGNHFDNSGGGREDPEAYGIFIMSNKNRGSIRQLHLTNFYIQGFYRSLYTSTNSTSSIESIYITHGEVKGREGFIFGGNTSATYLAGIHFDTWETAIGHFAAGGVHRVIGCDIRGDDEQAFSGYLVQLNSNQILFANNFVSAGGANGTQGGLIACNTQLPNKAENITITNNIMQGAFRHNYPALLVQTGNKNVIFGANMFYCFVDNGSDENNLSAENKQPWYNLAGSELYIYGQRSYN